MGLGVLAISAMAWLAIENVTLRNELRGPSADPASGTPLDEGQRLPSIPVVAIASDGEPAPGPTRLGDGLRGPTVFFVFTSTCTFCARSSPLVRELHRDLARRAIDLVGIAMDGRLPTVDRLPDGSLVIPYRVLAPAEPAFAPELGVPRVPAVLLVDRSRIVRKIWIGEVTPERAESVLAAASELAKLRS